MFLGAGGPDGVSCPFEGEAKRVKFVRLTSLILTYRYGGRDFRLTEVYGNVVKDIIHRPRPSVRCSCSNNYAPVD